MRVLIDTNILFSALLFPASVPSKALRCAITEHNVVLCDKNVAELREILQRKAPKFLPSVEAFLTGFSYEVIPAVDYSAKLIRDVKDQPILNAAIVFDVDIILTGDKDFLSLDIERPKCMTPAEFLEL